MLTMALAASQEFFMVPFNNCMMRCRLFMTAPQVLRPALI